MAVSKVDAGDLNRRVVFKQPTSSLNDEGGTEITYAAAFETWANVKKFNQYRTTEAGADVLIGSLDFTIRWSGAREAITKDWLIEYDGEDYVIHQIEHLDQDQRFIRFTARSRGTAVVSANSESPDTGGGSGGDVDKSNLSLTFTVPTALDVTVVVVKTDALQDALIDWGDGTQVTIPAEDPISESHSYAPGEWVCRIYPVASITDPQAQAVNKLRDVSILKTSGDGTMQIGDALTYAEFLRVLEAADLGMTSLPALPNTGQDQVRRVVVTDNALNGAELSKLLIALDTINWPVGYVDITGNPGTNSLTTAGLIARQNLMNKGWIVND